MIQYHTAENKINNPVFSIIIPTWNNLPFIELCVKSILKNSSFQHQIILHINDGSDGTYEWAKYQNLDFSFSEQNAGICLACNAAASLATADYILYINDDMYVCPEWDKKLFDAIQAYGKDDFYFSGTMIERNVTSGVCVSNPHDYGDSPTNFREAELLNDLPKLKIPDWNGANFPPSVMHRRMWHLIGGFSIEFSPGMYSDPDICRKLWQVGVRNFRGIGDSLVYHFMSKSVARVKKNDGRKQFMKKWGMSSNTFFKHYLKFSNSTSGHYNGVLTEPDLDFKLNFKLLIDSIKSKF